MEQEGWTWEDWLLEPFKWCVEEAGMDWNGLSVALVVLAFIGALFLFFKLLRGFGGGNYYTGYSSPEEEAFELEPRRARRVTRRKLYDVKPEVYDFSVPSPAPNLDNLRKPLKLDLEMAQDLFIPKFRKRK